MPFRFPAAQGDREWTWKSCDKEDQSSKDVLSEVENHIVNTKKIIPENLYRLSFGHTIAVGIALDPGSHFPESMGETNLNSLFMIVEDFMESETKSNESTKNFMSQVTKRMKTLSEKAKDVKKKKSQRQR